MAYLSNFTPEHMSLLEPIMRKLEQLKPDEAIVLDHTSPARRQRVRYVLYSWLSYNNLKSLYRISHIGATKLRVERRDRSDPTIVTQHERPEEAFVKEHMLDILDHAEALEMIKGKLSDPALIISTYEEWKRVQGL
jgi:hypothetical protein